ncbi:MAG: D-alanyl-D-alanine carboxypeptidase [Bacteroidaceae bacterium]|nr:D-alanyl-D-alanine carboxypeptidase [Bacteroidaceae bacterium]
MAKKKKRKLKRWVKVVLWSMMLTLGTWIIWWPANVLLEYWEEASLKDTQRNTFQPENVLTTHEADSAMAKKVLRFIESPTRLDTANIAVSVWDLSSNSPVVQWHDQELMVPASSLKLLTAISALKRLGHDHKYTEKVLMTGTLKNGILHGDIIFQADDNPMVETLNEYTNAISRAGIRKIDGRLILNLMRTDTLKAHHTASLWDIPYNRTPILLKGAPRVAQEIRLLLKQAGVDAPRPIIEKGIKIYPTARVLKSKTTDMTDVIAPMLIFSSNIKADALYYHVDHYKDRYTTGIGKREPVLDAFLRENLRYDTTGFILNDGSGLSPENMVSADFLLSLLRYAWTEPVIKDILINEALATPGHPTRRGSLIYRMNDPIFVNRIFCKTGTLTSIGASSLCGYAHGRNGRWYAFAIVNRNSPVEESRLYQDMLCKVLVK